MRNGTLSKLNRLVLVTTSGRSNPPQEDTNDAPVEYSSGSGKAGEDSADEIQKTRTTLFVFMAVSIACMTAAIGTGSYALWLSRHRAARQALTDVNDLLKSCQIRMQQLEADVQRLP